MSSTHVAEPHSTTPTRRSRVLEASRWSGALFVALAIPAAALGNPTNPYLDSADEYVAAYADGAAAAPLGRLLGLIALIAFLWALARLRVALSTEHGNTATAAIGYAGTLYAACWAGSVAAGAAVATAVDHADSFGDPDFAVVPATAFVVDFIADGLTWASLVAASVLAWAAALAGRRTDTLPGWLCWVGIVLVPLLPFAWLFFMLPMAAFLLWFATVVAIVPPRR